MKPEIAGRCIFNLCTDPGSFGISVLCTFAKPQKKLKPLPNIFIPSNLQSNGPGHVGFVIGLIEREYRAM